MQQMILSTVLRSLAAVIIGGLIGSERARHGRAAGMRTHILVCLGTCMTSMTSMFVSDALGNNGDVFRIPAQMVSGIGFLGAGMIILKSNNIITGLTTAAGNAMDNGAELRTNYEVTAIVRARDGFRVCSADGRQITARYLVNCAGGFADKIAKTAGDKFFEIIPRAGEYMLLDKSEGETVSHTIFQVPTANGKGILVTPTADGNLLLGPTAERVETPDNTETTAGGLKTVAELAKKSVPSVNTRAVITSFSGVRASEKNGDFIIKESDKIKGLIHAAAIDSPGLSSSAAIAEYIVELLEKSGLELTENPDFNGTREDTHVFKKMSDEEKDEYIKQNPAYGRIICRCETVIEGEIIDALRRNPKATDIDGVKRRTRAGMGRCQGGFCMPYVMRLIEKETGKPMTKITKKGGKSNTVTGRL